MSELSFKYKTCRKIDLINAYNLNYDSFRAVLKPCFSVIVENNKAVFFNIKAEDYNSIRLFLPAQVKAIVEHLGEAEDYTFITI